MPDYYIRLRFKNASPSDSNTDPKLEHILAGLGFEKEEGDQGMVFRASSVPEDNALQAFGECQSFVFSGVQVASITLSSVIGGEERVKVGVTATDPPIFDQEDEEKTNQ